MKRSMRKSGKSITNRIVMHPHHLARLPHPSHFFFPVDLKVTLPLDHNKGSPRPENVRAVAFLSE